MDIVHGLREYKFIKKHCLSKRFVDSFKSHKESPKTSLLAWNLHITPTNPEAICTLRPQVPVEVVATVLDLQEMTSDEVNAFWSREGGGTEDWVRAVRTSVNKKGECGSQEFYAFCDCNYDVIKFTLHMQLKHFAGCHEGVHKHALQQALAKLQAQRAEFRALWKK